MLVLSSGRMVQGSHTRARRSVPWNGTGPGYVFVIAAPITILPFGRMTAR